MTKSPLSQFNLKDQKRGPWLERAEVCATLLSKVRPPAGQENLRVADVGCGDMKLRAVLAERGLDVAYTGYDLLPQSEAVTQLDIATSPIPAKFDVVVLLGVTEYIADLPRLFSNLASASDYLIVSHVAADRKSYTREEIERLGWVSHKPEAAFEALLREGGYEPLHKMISDNVTCVWLCRSPSKAA